MRDVYFLGNREIKPISQQKGEAIAQLVFPLEKLITIDFNLDVLSQEQRSVYQDYMKYINYDKLEFDQVWCGKNNGYLLDHKGELWVFGMNERGQLGIIMNPEYVQRIPLNFNRMYIGQSNKYRSVSVGTSHVMVIDQLDKLYGWGSNNHSQTLVTPPKNITRPLASESSPTPDAFTTTTNNSKITYDPEQEQPQDEFLSVPILIREYKNLQKIICGFNCTFILMNNELYVQGQDKMGRLGKGPHIHDIEYPLPLMFQSVGHRKVKIKGVSSGYRHSLAWSVEGQLFSWGEGSYGKLGHQMLNNHYDYIIHYPQLVDMFRDRKIVLGACGYEHSLIIDARGQLIQFGQVRHKNKLLPPTQTYHDGISYFQYQHNQSQKDEKVNRYQLLNKPGQCFVKLSVYGTQSMALDSQDGLYVWGINQHDSLGFSNKTLVNHPSRLVDLSGIVHFAAGDGFALVVAKHNAHDKKTAKKQERGQTAKKIDRGRSPKLAFKQDCIEIVKSKIEHLKETELHKQGILEHIELDHFTKMSKDKLQQQHQQSITNQQPSRPRRQNTLYASPSTATLQSHSKLFHRNSSIQYRKSLADIDRYFRDNQQKQKDRKNLYQTDLDTDNLQLILEKMTQKRQENKDFRKERQLQMKERQNKLSYRISQVVSAKGLLMHQKTSLKQSYDETMLYNKMRFSARRVNTKAMGIMGILINIKAMHVLVACYKQHQLNKLFCKIVARKIQRAYRFYVLNKLIVSNCPLVQTMKRQISQMVRLRKVKQWINQFRRLQRTLIARRLHHRLYSSLIIVRNKAKMIQRQVKARLSDKKLQVAFMVRLFDAYVLKMVEVQKQSNQLTAYQEKAFEHLLKYQQFIKDPAYVFSRFQGQSRQDDLDQSGFPQVGLATLLDNYNYKGRSKPRSVPAPFETKEQSEGEEKEEKKGKKNRRAKPVGEAQSAASRQQRHQALLAAQQGFFDRDGLLIYSQDRIYFQLIPHHQIKFENKKVFEKVLDQIEKAEREVKEETMEAIVADFRLAHYNEKKNYLKDMDKFIHNNKRAIDIVRAKMMLKLKSEELRKINFQEQLQLDIQRNKNLMYEKDHLPFQRLIYSIGRKLKDSPQEPLFTISLSQQQFRHYFEQKYLAQLKLRCFHIIENYHCNAHPKIE